MTRRLPTPLGLTLAFLLLVVALLLWGGLYVRSVLSESIASAEEVRAARILVADVLRAQLDEETGVRGYAAARDDVLLEPYYEGRGSLPQLLSRLRTATRRLALPGALPLLVDAEQTNRQWVRRIAYPILIARKGSHVRELHGKILVDRVRDDMNALDRALARREQLGDERAQRNVTWVDFFALAAILAIALAAMLFSVQQYRLGVRLDQERDKSEEQRRKIVEVRAAYEAEKRIADTLQEAFAQRVLPKLPSVRLSAIYVPATEEAKVGGDWYDALQLTDDRIFFAIGDVAGHGLEAAVAMNKARQILTSCALIDPKPGTVLERVNAELMTENSPMITAVVGLVNARTLEVKYALAGHPAPILIEPGRAARFLEIGSLPLGVHAATSYETHFVRSVPGATLVLYTDGVIEHSHDVLRGETALLRAVESAARQPATETATAIREEIFDHHSIADDVAILTIHFLETATDLTRADALPRTA
jgi:serine phosphatase RsbU (regulator of sigma subunit)/CHASE3 domain sensor protein